MKNISILFVEDEDDIRENTLKALGYMCDTLYIASCAEDGLKLYKKYSPDIVITDIKMPKMDGLELARRIKQIKQNQHIIFTTAHSDNSYFLNAIEMQVDGYILKPIDYDLLEKKIKDIKQHINNELELKNQIELTKEIAKLQDNLLMVLDKDGEIIFSNDKFLEFFCVEDIDDFKKRYGSIDHLFLEQPDIFFPKGDRWLDEILKLESTKRIVSLKNICNATPLYFLVSIKKINKTSHTIVIFTEITDLETERNLYKNRAFTDELTSLYNRTYFNEVLLKQISIYNRNKTKFSLIIYDIDRFKNINDTFGHLVGDEVLQKLSKVISSHIRATDTLARWGGEEFVIVLPNTGLNKAKQVAKHLKQMVKEYYFSDDFNVTCSFGVAEFRDDDTIISILNRADKALYKAKNNGRDRVEVLE